MTLFKNKYRVETTRLKGWNYASEGYYFITVCTKNREHLFGHIENDSMKLNVFGEIVKHCWYDLPNHYLNVQLDEFCVMPNHIHVIIIINNAGIVETGLKPVSTTTSQPQKHHGLFEFVRALKTFSARRINEKRNSIGEPIWQSRFHDHIIRNEISLQQIREYIINNPRTWQKDTLNID